MPKRLDANAPYWLQIQAAERQIIEYAFEAGGDLPQTAMLLGISLPHLRRRVRVLGLSAKLGVRKVSAKAQRRRRSRRKAQAGKKAKRANEPALAKPRRRTTPTPGAETLTSASIQHVSATSAFTQGSDQTFGTGAERYAHDQAAHAGAAVGTPGAAPSGA